MKILVLNGSPRSNGNTAKMIDTFRESAEKNSLLLDPWRQIMYVSTHSWHIY